VVGRFVFTITIYKFFMNKQQIFLSIIAFLFLGASGGLIVIAGDEFGAHDPGEVVLDGDDYNLDGGDYGDADDIGVGKWAMHVLDVGQGDSIFLELPYGVQVLVDGGPDESVLSELGRIMNPWDRYIDYVVVTHPHADHISGVIEVLDRYDVGNIVINDIEYDSVAYSVLWDKVRSEGAQILDPDDLDRLIDGIVSVDVLYPSPEIVIDRIDNVNELCTVLEIDDGAHKALLMADIGKVVEVKLVELGVVDDVNVLKVGHQGSKFSSSTEFLDVVKPEIAVIPVGADNSYHHPHPSALYRLREVGAEIFRTDLDGAVDIYFDEDGISLDGWR